MRRLGRPVTTAGALEIIADGFRGSVEIYETGAVTGPPLILPMHEVSFGFWDCTEANAEDYVLFGDQLGREGDPDGQFRFILTIELDDEDATRCRTMVDSPVERVGVKFDTGKPHYLVPWALANNRLDTLKLYETIEGAEVPPEMLDK